MVKYKNTKLKPLWVWPWTFQAAGCWDAFRSLFLPDCQKCRFWHGFIVGGSFWSLQNSALQAGVLGTSFALGGPELHGALLCPCADFSPVTSDELIMEFLCSGVLWAVGSCVMGVPAAQASISREVAACSAELVCWKQCRWATDCWLASESSVLFEGEHCWKLTADRTAVSGWSKAGTLHWVSFPML